MHRSEHACYWLVCYFAHDLVNEVALMCVLNHFMIFFLNVFKNLYREPAPLPIERCSFPKSSYLSISYTVYDNGYVLH